MLTVTGLSKSFGEVHAVIDVSIEVPSGEVVALCGPSGSGRAHSYAASTTWRYRTPAR